MSCDFCGAEAAPRVLVCGCGRLVSGKRIATIAARAEGYEEAGATGLARSAWQEALGFLPPESGQARTIQERLKALEKVQPKFAMASAPTPALEARETPRPASASETATKRKGIAGFLGAIGVALLKFGKVILVFLYKLKWLLKATKFIPSLLSMGLYVLIYAQYCGWPFAIGFVAMIWIHEMGHVAVLVAFDKGFELPMFIPFMGAYVRGKVAAHDVIEQAWISLGGPVVGAVGAFAALAVGEWQDSEILRMVGQVGIWINLVNLVPVWILDGAKAARALDLPLWGAVTALVTAASFFVGEPWFALVCLLALPGVWRTRHPLPGTHEDVTWGRRVPPALVLGALAAGLILTNGALGPSRLRVLEHSGRSNDVAAVDSSFDSSPAEADSDDR